MSINMNTAFIGAGNIGSALIRAVCKSVPPKYVRIYDRNAGKTSALAEETGCTVCENMGDAIEPARFVIFCVKSQVLHEVLHEAAPHIKRGGAAGIEKVVVSVAAGIKTSLLKGVLAEEGLRVPIIRVMPNLPAAVGRGMILIAPGSLATDAMCDTLEQLFAYGGVIEKTSEAVIDMATGLSGSAPAFAFMFIEALADGGVQIGLARDKALLYSAQTVLGAAEMVLKTGTHPGALKDAVCSPEGTTISGVTELERHAFRGAVSSAVLAADERRKKM